MSGGVIQARGSVGLNWSGYLLGFALGGFFDGILLHQILQWHHLLSALEAQPFADIRVQILADGLFHALMYVIAAMGLWLLWRHRGEFAAADAGRLLFANVLIGFAVWHIVDGILSHWLIGIHRIKMDSANPLLWDLIWFFGFGIVPLLIGLWLRRNTGIGRLARGHASAAALAAVVIGAGALASRPPANSSDVTVFFRPGIFAGQVFAAADAVDARLVWSDSSGQVWVFKLSDPSRAFRLYRHGAMLVSNSVFGGCLSWLRRA